MSDKRYAYLGCRWPQRSLSGNNHRCTLKKFVSVYVSPATWIISVRISGSISGYNHRWTAAHAINVNIKNVPSRMSFTQSMASSPLSFLISINHIFSSLTPQTKPEVEFLLVSMNNYNRVYPPHQRGSGQCFD